MADSTKYIFHPIINRLQKMALYKTRSFFYIIGSDMTQTKFRVLKVDRTEPTELVLVDDKVEYTQVQVKSLLATINEGNKSSGRQSSGIARSASAFGILGFIRFWEGYYIILITKRRKLAVIGHHSIYKIEDTSLLYIPHESVRIPHDDEVKYVRLFNYIDLTSNFYFSYSYDLTNSIQYNMAPFRDFELKSRDVARENFINSSYDEERTSTATPKQEPKPKQEGGELHVGYRNKPNYKFVWNSYLLKHMREKIHQAWIIPVIHGFVAQNNICVYGTSYFLTLIARRSACYAGTRFLKRGTNFEGDVANEVESEQMLHDANVSSLHYGRFSSFVQIRGSIPCHWSQDNSKMVPKPPISIDVYDPYATAAGRHFNKLLRRFGSPVIVLNLVKRREKKPHESILNEEYKRLIRQLNMTIPPLHRIQHIAVDMARINKDKDENVMSHLADIAYKVIKKTGFFINKKPYFGHQLNPNIHYRQLERISGQGSKAFGTNKYEKEMNEGKCQTGVVRVNCVDCLDRTNTAQFALGKCALAFQLYTIGVLDKPFIEFDSDCVRILEEMYEDHGDTLALQYGGSQLVHRIETYRKTAPWTSQGSDLMQSFSRYYSNAFSDQEKQNAINLFLGVYVPSECSFPIWDLSSDYILHQSLARDPWPCHMRSTTQWWDSEVMDCLPFPADQIHKVPEIAIEVKPLEPIVDLFSEFHRPFEYNVLSDCFHFNMAHSVRDYMPSFCTDESPFCVRRRAGKKQEDIRVRRKLSEDRGKSKSKSPSMSGQPSTGSTASSGTSSAESASEDDRSSLLESEQGGPGPGRNKGLTYEQFFPPAEQTYGTLFKEPSPESMRLYQSFTDLEKFVCKEKPWQYKTNLVIPKADAAKKRFSLSNVYGSVEATSYEAFVAAGVDGPQPPNHISLLKYQEFASA